MHIYFSEHFKKQLKKLKKKFPNVKNDLLSYMRDFDSKKEISIGRSIFKIRIPSSDMKKGKSGGFRSYIYLYLRKDLLVPLCISPNSETESIAENELKCHVDKTIEEIMEVQ